jgi:hypothetical protein
LSFHSGRACAEGLELASFSYEYVPSAELDILGDEARELQTRSQTFTAKLAIPILLSGRNTALLNFITLRELRQHYDNVKASGVEYTPAHLYTIKYGLVFRQVISEQWSFATLIQPALLSDFEDGEANQVRLRAGFVFERRATPALKYGFGLGYSDDYGDEKILPVVRLGWRPTDRWAISFDVPQNLKIWYRAASRVSVGVLGKVTGAHFRVGEDVRVTDGRTTSGGSIKYSILNIGPALEVKLQNSLSLELNAGRSFHRRFELWDRNDNLIADSKFENSLFVKATLRYDVGN